MPEPERPKDAIRDAATVVLVRRDGDAPRVLMGQRGQGAAFLPSKFVFPGGAIDPGDRTIPAARPLPGHSLRRLRLRADPSLAEGLAIAAIRELWEETGLALSSPEGPLPGQTPADWQDFFDLGYRPDASGLEFIFRAITPAGRPRRFDARFFLVDAARIDGSPDDFSRAGRELSYLSWLSLAEARELDLPFVTEVVLAEVGARLGAGLGTEHEAARAIPFFHHADGKSFVDAL